MSHCPLCMQLPEGHNPVLLFLDIDGVMIGRDQSHVSLAIGNTIKELYPGRDETHGWNRYSGLEWRAAAARHFHPEAVEALQSLIKKIQETRPVYMILSSQWRNEGTLAELRDQVFSQYEFSKLIIGKTPPEDGDCYTPEIQAGITFETSAREKYGLNLYYRAHQIKYWLLEHGLEDAEKVVFDDEYMAHLREAFGDRSICVPYTLLTRSETDIALRVLGLETD